MNIITRNIPNSITCLNVAAGTLAIISALYPGAVGGMSGWAWACIFIAIAAVADFLDGFAARALHAYSDLGKELDSLCDLVSFGVAPAAIMYATLQEWSPQHWTPWLAVLIPVAGALRLARFNIDTRQTTSFIGLPIPANAIFWIGYSALLREGTGFMAEWYVILPVVVGICWLLNSPLRIFSLKFKTWGWNGNEARWLLILAAVACVFCMGVAGLMWLIVFYVGCSMLPFSRK